MNQLHRAVIVSNVTELAKRIHLNSLVPELLRGEKIFTDPMLQDIFEKKTDSDLKYAFLRELLTRGPNAFVKFKNALEKSGHVEAVAFLDEKVYQSHENNKLERIDNDFKVPESISGRTKPECYDDRQQHVIPAQELRVGVDVYKMTSPDRGLCILINNIHFCDPKKDRFGSDVDAERLHWLFKELGYEIFECSDLNAKEMIQILTSYAKYFRSKDYDSCVVIILSHGNKGLIYGTDFESVSTDKIFSIFNNYNCPDLIDKPKMFFIQACQGENLDIGVTPGISYDAMELSSPKDLEQDQSIDKRLPTCSDMLIAQSTIIGNISIRDHNFGSWFCQQLVAVFSHEAHNTDIAVMLRHVDNRVKAMTTCDGGKQATQQDLRGWSKALYFNPGLHKQ